MGVLFGERLRDFENAVLCCANREAIYRNSNPSKRYYKNNLKTMHERVPEEDQLANDWRIYDPRDEDDTSLFMFND